MNLYMYCKLQNTPNAWCIRPLDWEGCWNDKQELYAGSYVALFNTEREAKMICEQLNNAYYNNEKIKVVLDYIKQNKNGYELKDVVADSWLYNLLKVEEMLGGDVE